MLRSKLLVMLSFILLLGIYVACSNNPTQPDDKDNPGDTLTPGDTLEPGDTLDPGDTLNPGDTLTPGDTINVIYLLGDSIRTTGTGTTVDGTTVTVTQPNRYKVTGTLNNGQLRIDSDGDVHVYLQNAVINCSSSAPVNVLDCDNAYLHLIGENHLTDGTSYVFDDPVEEEPDAALFSKSDIFFSGGGSLAIDANFNHAVHSKDGITIQSGTLNIEAEH